MARAMSPKNPTSLKYSTMTMLLESMYKDRYKSIYSKFMEQLPSYSHELGDQRRFRLLHATPGSDLQQSLLREFVIGQPFIQGYPALVQLQAQYEKLSEQYTHTHVTLTKVMFDCDSPRVLMELFKFTFTYVTDVINSTAISEDELKQVAELQEKYKTELSAVKRYLLLNSM